MSSGSSSLTLEVGVKTDPIQYRYSFPWLFRIMKEEGIFHVQLGSFFELYQLPDEFFLWLRDTAAAFDMSITSVFTTHRELGGFLREEIGFPDVTARSYCRLVEVGALLGARSVGSSVGAVLRDGMEFKGRGVARFLEGMKAIMEYAGERGVPCINLEVMSSIAEPPTLLEEIEGIAGDLNEYHQANSRDTALLGYLVDISHGYVNEDRRMKLTVIQQLEKALPYLQELHLRNTDRYLEKTFGFTPEERERGSVRVEEVRDFLISHEDIIPNRRLVGYLEIPGPKFGRDYSDPELEDSLRQSIRYLKNAFSVEASISSGSGSIASKVSSNGKSAAGKSGEPKANRIRISASLMCADLCRAEEEVHVLRSLGADLLHIDIMDGRFTPNMPLGLEIVRRLRECSDILFDVHLMVEDNDFFVEKLGNWGIEMISVHAESATHIDRTLEHIRSLGMEAGVALNPGSSLHHFDYIGDRMDFVTLMTVNPGFAGQKMVPGSLEKIADCRAYLQRRDLRIPIQVDGNVSLENIPGMVEAGADILVAGSSSLFSRRGSLEDNMKEIRKAIEAGLAGR